MLRPAKPTYKTITKRPRRNHTPAFKAKVALAAVKGDKGRRHGRGRIIR
jgi:hypothetical protein